MGYTVRVYSVLILSVFKGLHQLTLPPEFTHHFIEFQHHSSLSFKFYTGVLISPPAYILAIFWLIIYYFSRPRLSLLETEQQNVQDALIILLLVFLVCGKTKQFKNGLELFVLCFNCCLLYSILIGYWTHTY